MLLSFRSRWTWHRELFNSEAQDTKHDQQQLDQYWGNHLNGWHIGYSRVSTRHFWIKSFEDIHHQRSRRRMPNVDQILHMKLLPFFWKCIAHFLFELRSTWILKNEIRRRPMSASVVCLSKLPILVNPWEGNYVWPDSYSNGIRRRHNGSVIYPVRISVSLHNGNWDRIFERISKIHLKLDFFNKSKQKTKILRRLALGGSQKLRQSSLQLGQNFWDDLKNSTNVICYLLR